MKIGDLWVKLGLKKDEFSRGIKEAEGHVKGFSGSMKSLSTVAKTVWGAVAAAVLKFASDSIRMTQRWGDEWNNTMAGIKGAYGTFVRQISSGEGWDNLFANMREAYRVSKEVSAALDEIFERKVSFSYQEAEIEKQIAAWQLIARDSSKSDAERKKANEEIISLTEKLGTVKKGIYEDEAAAQRKLFRQQTGMNDEQIDFLVRNYNTNRKIINESRDYLAKRAKLEKEISGSIGNYTYGAGNAYGYEQIGDRRSKAQEELAELDRTTSQSIKDIAALTVKYDKANDELVQGMADAEVAVIRVDTETMHAQTRATSLLGSLNRQSTGGTDTEREAAARVLKRAEDSAKSEIVLLTEKYNTEKALLEQYHMDTEALWQEYIGNINDILTADIQEEVEELEPIEFSPIEIVPPDMSEWDSFYKKYQDDLQRMQDLLADFRDAAIGGFSDAVQELADQFAGLEDINPGRVVEALLTPLADMAIKEGEILMAQGVGVEACKEALSKLNGVPALAAGAALIAIGAAAKSGLKSLAGGAGATTATTYTGATSTAAQTQTIQTEMTITVQGRLRGSDIYLSGQKAVNSWSR